MGSEVEMICTPYPSSGASGSSSTAEAFLFGRRTYEIFAGYWGLMKDRANPIASALNTRPKYVASTTLTDPQWADTTVLAGDLAVAIGELKAEPGGELQVHGSGRLVRWLFPDSGPDTALDLVGSRVLSAGITIQIYRPTGRPEYAPAIAG